MLIRSQNKKSVIVLDNIKRLSIVNSTSNTYELYADIGYSKYLGEYSTEEKAIKVLDKICEEYTKNRLFIGSAKTVTLIPVNFVFQLPQNVEV